ncbi:MAG: S9 family peptidase [Alphaproteobacteria bacterium]|nr:S9 family peptidase [Alphaproteobacteria bacterium]
MMKSPLHQSHALPPVAKRQPVTIACHGESRVDDYGWLRSPNYPDEISPEILDHLAAENRYADAVFAPHQPFKDELLAEMKARILAEKFTVPYRHGGHYYFSRFQPDAEHPGFYRLDHWENRDCSDGLSSAELTAARLIFDAAARARNFPFYQLGNLAPSPDGLTLALSEDRDGSEQYHIVLVDLASGAITDEVAQRTNGDLVWSADSQSIFTVELDESQRPRFLKQLRLSGESRLVYEESDSSYYFSIQATASGKRLLATADAREASEVRWLDLAKPDGALILTVPRRDGHIYHLFEQQDDFLVLTNDQHRNFRLCRTPIADCNEKLWQEIIEPSDDDYLTGCVAMDSWFAMSFKRRGLAQIRVFAAGQQQTVEFPDSAYQVGFGAMAAGDLPNLRLHYSSPIVPPSIFDFHPTTGRLELLKQERIPNHQPENYRLERLWIARDGVEIPVTLVRRKELTDAPQPILLYGYGAYGIATEASFREQRFSLIDRGIGFALAHVRGGDDLGWDWYSAGKLAQKTNSFDDFIAVAEGLVARGVTESGRIAALGGSAGGLLMGASLSRAPVGLFGAVLALVPFVDILNTMSDAGLPLTPGEFMEWGNPSRPEEFQWIKAYSPYENLTARAYPPVYLSAGLYDPRVTYWEPAKYCARLRAIKTNDQVVVLRTQMAAGHQGATGRYAALAELAEEYLFVILTLQAPHAQE